MPPLTDEDLPLESAADPNDDLDYVASCPACGDPIDYCRGHGAIGDPEGAATLEAHDAGDHSRCHPDGCELTTNDWDEGSHAS